MSEQSGDFGSGIDMSVVVEPSTRPTTESKPIARRMFVPVVRAGLDSQQPNPQHSERPETISESPANQDTAVEDSAATTLVTDTVEASTPSSPQEDISVAPEAVRSSSSEEPLHFDSYESVAAKLASIEAKRTHNDSQDRKLRHERDRVYKDVIAAAPEDVQYRVAVENRAFRERFLEQKAKEFSLTSAGNAEDPLTVTDKVVALYEQISRDAKVPEARIKANSRERRRILLRKLQKNQPDAAEFWANKDKRLQRIVTKANQPETAPVEASQSVAPQTITETPDQVASDLNQAFPYAEPAGQTDIAEEPTSIQVDEHTERDASQTDVSTASDVEAPADRWGHLDTGSLVGEDTAPSETTEVKADSADENHPDITAVNPDFSAFTGMVPRPGGQAVQIGENMGAGTTPVDASQPPAEQSLASEVTAEDSTQTASSSSDFPRANPADTAALQAEQTAYWNEQQDKKKDYVQRLLGDKPEATKSEDQALYDGPDHLTDEQRDMWRAANGKVTSDVRTEARDQMAANAAAPVIGQRRGPTEFNVPPVLQETPQSVVSSAPEITSIPSQPSAEQVTAWQREAASGLTPEQIERGGADERVMKAKEAMQSAAEELKKRESALDNRSAQGKVRRLSSRLGIAILAGTMMLGAVGTATQNHEASPSDTKPSADEIAQNPNVTGDLTAPMVDSGSSSPENSVMSSMPTSNEAGLTDPSTQPDAKAAKRSWWSKAKSVLGGNS